MRLLNLLKPSLASAAIAALAFQPRVAAADLTVVASIPPVHSLVAGVMEGVGEVHLLVKGGASPHTYALRPSDASLLNRADVVFWVGEELEAFLAKPMTALGGGADVVALSEAPKVRVFAAREGGVWEEDEHAHEDESGHADEAGDHHEHGGRDMHIWLDPANAGPWSTRSSPRCLAAMPPCRTYAANGTRVRARLEGLTAELRATLAPLGDKPFMVFHDAYQYFENAFGLAAVGALSVAPQRLPGAKRLGELRERLTSAGVVCVFREPQFAPKLAETLVEGSSARIGVLDPLGAGLTGARSLFPVAEIRCRGTQELPDGQVEWLTGRPAVDVRGPSTGETMIS
jgi:zinc transport system substrate-binding protein